MKIQPKSNDVCAVCSVEYKNHIGDHKWDSSERNEATRFERDRRETDVRVRLKPYS